MRVKINNEGLMYKLAFAGFIGGFAILFNQCTNESTGETEKIEKEAKISEESKEDEALKEKASIYFASISSLPKQEFPEEKIELGEKLFMDPRLSKDGNISCNSCHNLNTYGVDNLPLSPGDTDEFGARNSPTVFYAHLHGMQFWDGRAKDVEEQAGGPILNPVEHNIPSEEFLEERIRGIEEYQKMFAKVYPDSAQPITFETITKAIGAFERQLTPLSRFDKWLDGDNEALNTQEKKGLTAFIDNQCITCHNGPAFGGNMLQKFGVNGDYWELTKSEIIDHGLFDLTQEERDRYKFKTPGLRNVEMTYPYFHDGSVEKLEDAVRIMGQLQINEELTDQEVKDITAFLKSLTALPENE